MSSGIAGNLYAESLLFKEVILIPIICAWLFDALSDGRTTI
jgi:hypothetical protein